MTNEELYKAFQRLSYHVELLGNTIDSHAYPIEALILSMNWNKEDLDKAHDVFERWETILESGEKMNNFKFEKDFEDALGVSYQGLKPIVLAFYRNSLWTNVCEAYVDSFDGKASIEYREIMNRDR